MTKPAQPTGPISRAVIQEGFQNNIQGSRPHLGSHAASSAWQPPEQPHQSAQAHQQPHQQPPSQQQAPHLDFNDHQQAFQHKPTARLLHTLAVFKACSFPPFVQNAMRLYDGSRRVIGQSATDALVRNTFFKQFCGGALGSSPQLVARACDHVKPQAPLESGGL